MHGAPNVLTEWVVIGITISLKLTYAQNRYLSLDAILKYENHLMTYPVCVKREGVPDSDYR